MKQRPDAESNTGLSDCGASYFVRRLQRDAPDIVEALARGEYLNARAAGRVRV